MDAARYLLIEGNEKLNISKTQAVRMEMANDLRNFADQIESGDRGVILIQTQEKVAGDGSVESQLYMTTHFPRKAEDKPK